MFDAIKLRYRERRWSATEQSIRDEYKALLAKEKSGVERERLHWELGEELHELDRARRDYIDGNLLRKARRHYVPIPLRRADEGLWVEWDSGEWYLTEKGVYYLLKAIRDEQKERLALWKARLDLVVGW